MATLTPAPALNAAAGAATGRSSYTLAGLPSGPGHNDSGPTDFRVTGTATSQPRTFTSNEILFWQINLQKSMKAIQELAFRLAHLKSRQPFVILIQEPYLYKGSIPYLRQYGSLYHSLDSKGCRTSILVSPHLTAWCDNEFLTCDICACTITTNNRTLYVVSAYHDINKPTIMAELDRLYRSKRAHPIILGCDTNAHSTTWGCELNNRRGDEFEEFIAREALMVENVGNTPTFLTRNAQSIIDVTLTNMHASHRIFNWHVNTSPSCSDHRYVEYVFKWSVPPCRGRTDQSEAGELVSPQQPPTQLWPAGQRAGTHPGEHRPRG